MEPSAGCDRTVLAIICEAYDEEELVDDKGKKDVRTVLRFVPRIAPIKAAIFPLLKKNEEQVRIAREIEKTLQPWMTVFYDEAGAVGRRYRRQDEVGTPFCITVDFETLGENDPSLKDTVTIRHRDSMEQERVAVKDLLHWLIAVCGKNQAFLISFLSPGSAIADRVFLRKEKEGKENLDTGRNSVHGAFLSIIMRANQSWLALIII